MGISNGSEVPQLCDSCAETLFMPLFLCGFTSVLLCLSIFFFFCLSSL